MVNKDAIIPYLSLRDQIQNKKRIFLQNCSCLQQQNVFKNEILPEGVVKYDPTSCFVKYWLL